MGGERFDTTQPEAYLFGENQDLNFLGNRPVPVRLYYLLFLKVIGGKWFCPLVAMLIGW